MKSYFHQVTIIFSTNEIIKNLFIDSSSYSLGQKGTIENRISIILKNNSFNYENINNDYNNASTKSFNSSHINNNDESTYSINVRLQEKIIFIQTLTDIIQFFENENILWRQD